VGARARYVARYPTAAPVGHADDGDRAVAFRRRRARGERATGWLVGLVVLGLCLLGAIVGAGNSGS
jgi:hypothetical protein